MDRQIEAACLLRGNPSGLIPDLAEAAIAASVDAVFAEATSPVYPGLNLEHVVQGPPGVGVTAATWSGAWGRERRAADVTNFVLHTVEGPYSAGLSVARNGDNGAGFDLLTDPVRRVISGCNDWRRYISHQAGYWPMNLESIGIEQAGSASQTGSWSDDYYRWFGASVIAVLAKLFPNVPLRECTAWNQSGLIRHSTIYETAPGVNFRADPGRGYKMGLVLDAAKKAGGPVVVQPPPPRTAPEYVYLGAWAKEDLPFAEAAKKALAAGGYAKAVLATSAGDLLVQSEKVLGLPAGRRPFLVIGSPTTAKLSTRARAAKRYPLDASSNLWDCVGPSVAGTGEEVSWRLADLCKRAKLDADKVLDAYRAELDARRPQKPPDPVAPPKRDPVAAAVEEALAYGFELVGTPYEWDETGVVGAGAPFWASEDPAPEARVVRASTSLCAGLTNLLDRRVGAPNAAGIARAEAEALAEALEASAAGNVGIPRSGQWFGGTLAYWPYYAHVAEPFDINKRYPAGTLIMRRSRWDPNGPFTADQGHVAVIFYVDGVAHVLQSFAPVGSTRPGVTASVKLVDSHAGGFYERAVLPQHWLVEN